MTSWPDVEGALRDYLRADAGVAAIVDNRGFFGIPNRAHFPLFTVRRIAGGQDPGEAPIDRALMQIDCWGPDAGGGAKRIAYALTAAVRDALSAIRGATTQGDVVLFGALVSGAVFAPDPETDQPRYALTVDVTARAVTAA